MTQKLKLLVLEEREVFEKHALPEMLAACDVKLMSPFSPVEQVVEQGRDAEVLLVNPTIPIRRELIAALPKLKLIQTEGVGYEGVDLPAADERGVYVCNCPGVNARAVAEHTVLLMLCCLRDVINGYTDVITGRQNDKKVYYMKSASLRELGDCTVGFIGFGAIGREAARLTAAFGARNLYYKPHRLRPEEEVFAAYRELDALLAESDIVSLNLPLNPQTENMADAAFFAKMKPGAYLINTARGGLVRSEDLVAALASGHLAGAGLDCLANEPVQTDNVLVAAPESVRRKIVFTPHIAGVTASSFTRTYAIIWENIQRVAEGEPPLYFHNKF